MPPHTTTNSINLSEHPSFMEVTSSEILASTSKIVHQEVDTTLTIQETLVLEALVDESMQAINEQELENRPQPEMQLAHTIEGPSSSMVLVEADQINQMQNELEVMLRAAHEQEIQFKGVHVIIRQKEQELATKKEVEQVLKHQLKHTKELMTIYKVQYEGQVDELLHVKDRLSKSDLALSLANQCI